MGLFDKFFGGGKSGESSGNSNTCPACGAMAATIGGRVLCGNPSCKNFAANALSSQPSSSSSGSQPQKSSFHVGSFSPQKPITVRYQNFRGEQKIFTADANSVIPHKNFISMQVAPSGQRITLARKRILNFSEFQNEIHQPVPPGKEWPTAKERQVLNYHKKHGSTSPLYEQIRAKYPNW